MDYVVFGAIRPLLPPRTTVGVCLLWDTAGICEAVAWLKARGSTDGLYRIVVPCAPQASTYAHFLLEYGETRPPQTLWDEPELGEPIPLTGPCTLQSDRPWPFLDDPGSIPDILLTHYHWVRRSTLPHPYSGLSRMQQTALDLPTGTSLLEQRNICVARFGLPATLVLRHLLALKERNCDARSRPPIPLLLVNGTYPLHPRVVAAEVLRMCDGYDPQLEMAEPWFHGEPPWNCTMEEGVITRLPYNTYPEDYPELQNRSGTLRVSCIGKPVHREHPKQWETFDGHTFKTFNDPNEYIRYWFRLKCTEIGEDTGKLVDSLEFNEAKQQVIFSIFVRRAIEDIEGNKKRYLIDQRLNRKRQQLSDDYEAKIGTDGVERLLNIPLRELGPREVERTDTTTPLPTAQEVLKKKVEEFFFILQI